MAEKAIVAVIKNDPIITVIPSDIQLIHNFLITNDEHL